MIDVIGIGALNYDYMFYCKKAAYTASNPENGMEDISSFSRELIVDEIYRLIHTTTYDIQYGGSAFLALKTVNAIDPSLKTSFVGVYSNPTDVEISAGFQKNVVQEFAFLSNRDWLFYHDEPPGISLIRLYKGLRNYITVDTGSNNNLVSLIERKEHNGSSFVVFLSHAKWIHISSLTDFNQFLYIVDKIKAAKILNPHLIVSFDPGYEYTKKYRKQLKDVLGLFNYIFLNENELNNLLGDANLNNTEMYNELSTFLLPSLSSNMVILESKSKSRIIHFINGIAHTKTIWNKVLNPYKIYNDTGAGDAFAGGVIVAMLSNDLLIQQSLAIKIGATAASARMTAKKDSFNAIRIATRELITSTAKNEELNNKQRFRIIFNKWFPRIVEILLAILTGLITSAIWEMFR